jgi:hypothetical protein
METNSSDVSDAYEVKKNQLFERREEIKNVVQAHQKKLGLSTYVDNNTNSRSFGLYCGSDGLKCKKKERKCSFSVTAFKQSSGQWKITTAVLNHTREGGNQEKIGRKRCY